MGARLVATVYVTDPETHQTAILDAGSEPAPHLAALVTNPGAWEDGKLPTAAEEQSKPEPASSGDEGDKPAAKRAANRPARGRKSADEGSS